MGAAQGIFVVPAGSKLTAFTYGQTLLPTPALAAATNLSADGATLNGAVNPNGAWAAGAYFQYGLSTSYGSQTASTAVGTGTSAVAVSAAVSGLISGTTYHYCLTATSAAGSVSSADGTFVVPSPTAKPVITSASAVTGTTGSAFDYQITAINYPSSFLTGLLPAGLNVNGSTGLISGTPSSSGTFEVSLMAANSLGNGSSTLQVIIFPQPPMISGTLETSGTGDYPFNYQVSASNDPSLYNATGLPTGLSIDPVTGMISGTATVTGTFAVTVSAINWGGTGSALVSLVVETPPAPVISSTLSAFATEGLPFSYQITGNNVFPAFGASGLPAGLNFDAGTGLISGTPAATGTFAVSISAMNLGGTDDELLALTVLLGPPIITGSTTATAVAGLPFSYQITAADDASSYGASGLPPGLSIEPSTGLISGTPTSGGTFTGTVSAINASGTGSAIFSIAVDVPAAGLQGTYAGLGATNGMKAAFFKVTVNGKGDFTGKFLLPGEDFPLKGMFSLLGQASGAAKASGASLEYDLAITPLGPEVSGSLSILSKTGQETLYAIESGLVGTFKGWPFPAGVAGRYTLVLPATSSTDPALPGGPGFGTMTVNTAGSVIVKGKMGDGTPFSTSSFLREDGKTWTLFDVPYSHGRIGSLAGEIAFENRADSDAQGNVDWIKPTGSSPYYFSGFTETLSFAAAKYAAPAMTSGGGHLLLTGGNIANGPLMNDLKISPTENVSVTGSCALTLKLTPDTGMFEGRFQFPGTVRRIPYDGVIYQKPVPGGFGLFLGTDQSGEVDIWR